jgi:hypothetical protein
MKDLHKAVCAVLVIFAALYLFHMFTAHQGTALMGGLGTK